MFWTLPFCRFIKKDSVSETRSVSIVRLVGEVVIVHCFPHQNCPERGLLQTDRRTDRWFSVTLCRSETCVTCSVQNTDPVYYKTYF